MSILYSVLFSGMFLPHLRQAIFPPCMSRFSSFGLPFSSIFRIVALQCGHMSSLTPMFQRFFSILVVFIFNALVLECDMLYGYWEGGLRDKFCSMLVSFMVWGCVGMFCWCLFRGFLVV